MQASGGYVTHRTSLIRSHSHAHTDALERPVSDLDLGAINAIQATPWRINQWVLDVMMEAWTGGHRIAGLEVGEPLSMLSRIPPTIRATMSPEEREELSRSGRLPDPVWDRLVKEDRDDYIRRRAAVHAENASIIGRSRAILDNLSVAMELRDKPAIWYPHTKDFRGRIYPAATFGPQPQGNDISKALLMFAEGVPLGLDGEFWLRVRAANTYGQDKLSLEDRVSWTFDHATEIISAAQDPLTQSFWQNADEPWGFLATCRELELMPQCPDRTQFVSHLPCPMDGTCNGLQHLAAMGLDPIGANATNLTPNPIRQDIYEAVAEKVRSQVEADALAGIEQARVWLGQITRKVVKRAVMTTPYGVTDRGIRDQLLGDGLVPKDEEIGQGAAADYLRDQLVIALGGTAQSARSIMAWLQSTADRLAKAGLPFDWTTPSGSKVREAYHSLAATRLRTLSGRVTLHNEERAAGLNVRKQALGAAPNVIHSFDAAHMALTVDAAVKRGITSFAMIHDSYGTHAGHTAALAAILRQQFVAIYQDDWLGKLASEVMDYAPHVKIDPPPTRGDFDIRQVLDAPYFFS